jgi:hypothetical protein
MENQYNIGDLFVSNHLDPSYKHVAYISTANQNTFGLTFIKTHTSYNYKTIHYSRIQLDSLMTGWYHFKVQE